MATCSKCLKKEQPGDADEILLCDGCDLEIHVSCAGLTTVPLGDWLCAKCLAVMDARRRANLNGNVVRDADGRRTLITRLPPLPRLDDTSRALGEDAQRRFNVEITARRDKALNTLIENQRVLEESSRERIATLTRDVEEQTTVVERAESSLSAAKRATMRVYGLRFWKLATGRYGESHIEYHDDDGNVRTVYKSIDWIGGRTQETKCPGWNRYDNIVVVLTCCAGNSPLVLSYYNKVKMCSRDFDRLPEKNNLQNAKNRLATLEEDLKEVTEEEKERPRSNENDKRELLLGFAKLLSEPQLPFELKSQHNSRKDFKTMFLGVVNLEDSDVRVLNLLKEPTELVLTIPVDANVSIDDDTAISIGQDYYIFGIRELFSIDRDVTLPMDFSPTSMRAAQRDLMAMLFRDPRNQACIVSKPSIPSSVVVRGTSNDRLGDLNKFFDLGELVRDCNYPVDKMPAAETPKRLADNGLVLRNYQKTTLKWLIDKERNISGIGSSGQLWSRMRGLNCDQSFYFCEVTGSLVLDIFNYASDVEQSDSAIYQGDTFPSSAIVASEMGLGKTVMALSLIVESPPSIENISLPREHICTIKHPSYVAPPLVPPLVKGHQDLYLSNGTLVIAPMTLCPQWQAEIKRFAPWMKCLTLHNEEIDSLPTIASADVVVISTFMVATQRGKPFELMKKLRKIHFHRIFLDESHLNHNNGRHADNSRDTNSTRIYKTGLAQLSATHRYCVTGTPVGQSLADLYGQLRFLRVPLFCREDFFTQNIGMCIVNSAHFQYLNCSCAHISKK